MSVQSGRRQQSSYLLHYFRVAVRLVSHLSPSLAGRWVNYLWYRTQRFKEPGREKSCLEKADWQKLHLDGGAVQTYVWGEGDQSILLVHGWNGRGAQLGAIALFLAKNGYRVIAFDLPGHGRSEGKRTDIPTVSSTLQALEQYYGSFHAAVAHSFGGMCLMHAVGERLQLNRIICISTPLDVATLMDKFCFSLRLPSSVVEILKQLFEQRFGDDVWHRFSMVTWTRELTIPGLVIHDRDDGYVQPEDAVQIGAVWPECEIMLTDALGHHRILRELSVMQKITDFIQSQ